MRELHCAATQTAEEPAAVPARRLPPKSVATAADLEPLPDSQSVTAQRVAHPTWFTVVMCTSTQEGAGLTAAGDGEAAPAVFMVLHGSAGSSHRVKLPSQAGDFQQGQEDVFRWVWVAKQGGRDAGSHFGRGRDGHQHSSLPGKHPSVPSPLLSAQVARPSSAGMQGAAAVSGHAGEADSGAERRRWARCVAAGPGRGHG